MVGEPWECQLKVKAYSFEEGLLKFEISADELNKENVHFNWEPNGNCKIEITQRDKDIPNISADCQRARITVGRG
jgi:hypothetical protein